MLNLIGIKVREREVVVAPTPPPSDSMSLKLAEIEGAKPEADIQPANEIASVRATDESASQI